MYLPQEAELSLRWFRQFIQAENPELSHEQIDQEDDRSRATLGWIAEAGHYRSYKEWKNRLTETDRYSEALQNI